jgi:hypothetical protein
MRDPSQRTSHNRRDAEEFIIRAGPNAGLLFCDTPRQSSTTLPVSAHRYVTSLRQECNLDGPSTMTEVCLGVWTSGATSFGEQDLESSISSD